MGRDHRSRVVLLVSYREKWELNGSFIYDVEIIFLVLKMYL